MTRRRVGVAALALACACKADPPDAGAETSATDGPGTGPLGTTTGAGGTSGGASTGAEPAGDGLSFEEVVLDEGASGPLTLATAIAFVPGTDEFLLVGLDGRVGHFALDGARARWLGEFTVPNVHMELDCGSIALAFDPDFAGPGGQFIWVASCLDEDTSQIQRLTFDPPHYDNVAGSAAEILTLGDPNAPRPWHNVGSLGFDDDGVMWALFGDKARDGNGQDTGNALGALVRIVPDRSPDGSGYTVPPDNPFVDEDGWAPEIYAYGFRSPWLGQRDSQGRYWVGDVGHLSVEEIDVVTRPGQNFGWADHEGPCAKDCGDAVDPAIHWEHDAITQYMKDDDEVIATVRRVVWVGPQYVDRGNDPYAGLLTGRVLFGDRCLGYVRAAQLDGDDELVADVHLGHLAHVTGWAQAADGFLYAVSFGRCESADIDPADPPPARLFRAVLD